MPPSERQAKALQLYANLMEEVKIRIDAINLMGNSKLAPRVVRESCFLQLRMLCELIALSALAAHGDIEETTKLRKEYAAEKIIKRLEQLHQHFYPWPVKQVGAEPGVIKLEGIHDGYLTKPDLLKLYGLCGNELHRGNLKKLLSPADQTIIDNRDIGEWGQKIQTLLGYHGFGLFDMNTLVICMLRNPSDNNRVQIAIMPRQPASK